MPLVKGKKARTRSGVSENISKETRAGKKKDQAGAIAMSAAGKKRSKRKK